MEPGRPPPPTVSQVSTARSPSRRTSPSLAAVAVSHGSAADRRRRAVFSPPQSPTAKAAQRVRNAVEERQACKAASFTRDAARGANGGSLVASSAGPALESAASAMFIGEAALYLGPPSKDFKKPRLVHVVRSDDQGTSFDVRQATGVELLCVPRSRLCTRSDADPAVFACAEASARKVGERARVAASTMPAAASSVGPALASATSGMSPDEAVLHLGPLGKDFKKPRLVHVVGSGDQGTFVDVRQATGVVLSRVSRSRLLTKPDADPAVFAAAELTAQRARTRAAAPRLAAAAALRARAGDATSGLAPSPDRLAQVAEAAQEAMSGITARTVCAVCCCTVQEANTVSVVVTDEPPTVWHAKLKATPAMELHAELRAQYTIANNGAADVHPRWTDMHVNLVIDWTGVPAW